MQLSDRKKTVSCIVYVIHPLWSWDSFGKSLNVDIRNSGDFLQTNKIFLAMDGKNSKKRVNAGFNIKVIWLDDDDILIFQLPVDYGGMFVEFKIFSSKELVKTLET